MALWHRVFAAAGLGLIVRGALLAGVMWAPDPTGPWLLAAAAAAAAWAGTWLGARLLGGLGPAATGAAGLLIGLVGAVDLLARWDPLSRTGAPGSAASLSAPAAVALAAALSAVGGWFGGARRNPDSPPVALPAGTGPGGTVEIVALPIGAASAAAEKVPLWARRWWAPRWPARERPGSDGAGPGMAPGPAAAAQAQPLPSGGAGWLALGAGLCAVTGVSAYTAAMLLAARPAWWVGLVLAAAAPLAGGAVGSLWARRAALPASADAPVLAALLYAAGAHVAPEMARVAADRTLSPGFFAAALAPAVAAVVGALVMAAVPPYPPETGSRAPTRPGLAAAALAGMLIAGAAALWGHLQIGPQYGWLAALVVSSVAGLALGAVGAALALAARAVRAGPAAAGMMRWAAYLATAGLAAALAGLAGWVAAGAPWFA